MANYNDHIVFSVSGSEQFANSLQEKLNAVEGRYEARSFPDGESYVRVLSEVNGKFAVVVCSLSRPNERMMPLYFLGRALSDLRARHICLVAPYLAYMRQDKVFLPGEAITSSYFAEFVSSFADSILTADPHLHRRDSLSEIYPIPNTVVRTAGEISSWIKGNVEKPLLVGPDSESEQWVSEVAQKAGARFTVLQKTRTGDREVEVSMPEIDDVRDHTPVLVDDIVSTARTMIETTKNLMELGMRRPICIGVHAVFADDAYEELLASGVEKVITSNTIAHISNAIDVSALFADALKQQHLKGEKHGS